jgi:dipeptidase
MCFTVVLGRRATVDGSVLVGHNEENHGPYLVNFRRVHVEQLSSPALAERRSAWPKPIRLPRYGFLWSQIPGREYSDSYLNDAGVVIVSNGCPSREDDLETLIERGEIQQEGIGGLLRRVVAEQAASARHAVELIGQLVEQLGYRDSGRTYVVADPQEAWVVAVVRGRRWLAQRVPDDAAVVVPNVFIFDDIPLDALPHQAGEVLAHRHPDTATDRYPNAASDRSLDALLGWSPENSCQPRASPSVSHPMGRAFPSTEASDRPDHHASGQGIRYSADLISYAIQRGWYDPGSGKPFSFREAYQTAERNRPDLRQWWGQQLLLHPELLRPGADARQGEGPPGVMVSNLLGRGIPGAKAQQGEPSSGGPEAPLNCPSPATDLFAQAQPTGPLPWYVRPGGKLSLADVAVILRHRQEPVSLFHPATQETAVFQLRESLPRPIGCVYWRSVGRPDWSPLLPWYLGVQEVPSEYCHPAFRTQWEMWNPAEPLASEIFQPDFSLIWWKFHALRQLGDQKPEEIGPTIRAIWHRLEQKLYQEQPMLETELLALWRADPDECRRRMTSYSIAQSETVRKELDRFLDQWHQQGFLEKGSANGAPFIPR